MQGIHLPVICSKSLEKESLRQTKSRAITRLLWGVFPIGSDGRRSLSGSKQVLIFIIALVTS